MVALRGAADGSGAPHPLSVAVGGALILAAAMGIGRFAYTPLLPPMMATLDWTVSQGGDVASANFLGYVIGALSAAMLGHGDSRRRWLVAGMLLSALTTAAGIWTVDFPAWLLVRFLSGIASAFCLVMGTSLVIEYLAAHDRIQLGAIHFSGVGIGIVVSVLAIEAAVSQGYGVSSQWGVLGWVSIVMLVCSWFALRGVHSSHRHRERSVHSQRYPKAASRQLARLVLAYGLFGFGYVVTATFIVTMARRLEGTTWLEPATWIVVGLFAAPSILFWQRLAHPFGIFAVLRVAYLVEAVGVLLAGFGSGPLVVVTGGALLGATFMGITALGLGAARQIAGAGQDRAIGWMTASFGIGQLLGPAVAGRLAEWSGGFAVPSLVAASMLVLGIVLLTGEEKHRPALA